MIGQTVVKHWFIVFAVNVLGMSLLIAQQDPQPLTEHSTIVPYNFDSTWESVQTAFSQHTLRMAVKGPRSAYCITRTLPFDRQNSHPSYFTIEPRPQAKNPPVRYTAQVFLSKRAEHTTHVHITIRFEVYDGSTAIANGQWLFAASTGRLEQEWMETIISKQAVRAITGR